MNVRDQTEEGRLSVNLAVQRSRAIAFAGMYAVAMIGKWGGILEFDSRLAHALVVVALGSAAFFDQLYRRRLDRRWGVNPRIAWMACDVVFVTWVIYLTHDSSSLWLVWYLTNTAAATFVAGRPAAFGVAVANSVAYLALLVALGDIRGFDQGLAKAVIELAVLYSASFFFLRGIADLRDKRLRIRELAREKSRQLEELKSLTAKLDRQARELSDAHLESQEASRAKSQFLANMSHELRTPLNSIIGFSEILGVKLEDQLEPRNRKFLRNIFDSGKHLLALINDILDLSKIEAGKMELSLEKVSVADIVQGVRSVMLGVVGHRGIDLETELPEDLPLLVADGPKVKQILYNLISNAIKFSPDGSRVEIGARAVAPAGSELPAVEIWVSDQGIGIAPDEQEAIFEEFCQVDGESTRAHGGTGLGLALVRRLAEMHGGNVRVDSTPGRGSTFRVLLPVDASEVMLAPAGPIETRAQSDPAPRTPTEAREMAETAETADSGRPVVMVVEDDEPFFHALSADLEGAGYRPRWAHRGEDALRLAKELRPAAITLDLELPGMDGWEVLKALKDEPMTSDIPVIIVSLMENHELGFALGADDYFMKPLDRRRFLHRLRELLGATGTRPALVIDDDAQVHEMLEEELAKAGYEVLCAHDGRQGLDLAASRQPAIIVLDLMMPELNGFEVATMLRDDPATAAIPIVVLSAKELTPEDRERLHGKIEGVLSKTPMDRRLIVRSIQEIVNRRNARGLSDSGLSESQSERTVDPR